ncbi:helix-turn-helix transcriptional regulator [Moheibacter sediminis]|uniref:Regulatory protein, luxR family n=1 Tax=Moheibacter sediminis TaxID=1434700 RepID=A0A1W1Y8U8_9FLAO|nr:hypothetical protein [Moheibacter sediminis]SMC32566.1 regulatory protein, luxR family [Moheibacter sediminis]
MRVLILFIFFLTSTFSIAQENDPQKKLLKETQANHNNFNENPKKAFEKAVLFIKNAKKINAHKAELTAIMTQCKYYRNASDYEKFMEMTKKLEQKAKLYNEPIYEASAKVYQSEIYYHNSQPKKWRAALEYALKVLEKSPPDDSLTMLTRSNIYICLSNYHTDFETRIKYIKKSNENQYAKELYMGYSNLAVVFYKHNLDSAKHYALLSLKAKNAKSDYIFNNYMVLSKVALKEEKYQDVINYAKKAEEIKGYKDWYNIQLLYANVIDAYEKLNDQENLTKYKSKNDSLTILISQNQKKYLLRALNENEKPMFGKNAIIAFSVFVILLLIIFYFLLRKSLKRKNTISKESETNIWNYDYSKLVEILKNKDKSFMVHFDEAFPEFSKKLLELNPKIVQSEIEFCALLKLKIPTKDIAAYTNIEAKTVRNKKYRIRRKLNIPDGTDIYQWFHDF